ncbi:LysR family transcriptional regulator [Microbulbifer sp. CNSA002]|uniref:LysR family transcriptional regulator n=1 Tax=Microbulbifer sp. CNSA002 TaxID=3373604 RepID=UPI0039B4AB55
MISGVDAVQFAGTGKWYRVQITHVVSTTEKMLHKRKPVNGYFQFEILKYAASETYLYFLLTHATMTLEQLRYFKAIVEGGSLKAAAQTLHRTQPTISAAIKKLEADLNLQLFDRDQYRSTLTADGKALYEQSKYVLAEAHSFESLAKQLVAGEELEVGIAFTSAIPVGPILSAIRQCKIEYPKTRLEVYSENGLGPLDLLKGGQVSIAIIPWTETYDQLESIHLMNMKFISVIAGDSPLLTQYDEVPRQIMLRHPQVIISGRKSSTKTYGVLEGGDQWRVNDFPTKKEIILQGMGWGTLPEHMIEAELEQGLLSPIAVEGIPKPQELEVRVARQASNPMGPVASYLWQLFLNLQGFH